MKRTILILSFLLVQIVAFGQSEDLPKEIVISDKFNSPWGRNFEYKYKYELAEKEYQVIRIFKNENGKIQQKPKRIGSIETRNLESLIDLIKTDSTFELSFKNFSTTFNESLASNFIKEKGSNYWITSDIQKEYLFTQLTQPQEIERNLKSYFKNYDHSNWIDGSSTEISISFRINNKEFKISSTSILEYAFPININNIEHFNPELSKLIAIIIPETKTNRQEQLFGSSLFNNIAIETINNHRKKLDELEASSYRTAIDSLKKHFIVTNTRVVNGISSTSWDGEKRLSCLLSDPAIKYNISILYSSQIVGNKLQFPPSIIISRYHNLIKELLSIKYFNDYLLENKERKIVIIFDDNSCFTSKSRERFAKECKISIDFNDSLLLAVWDENKELSDWIVLPNGKFLLWMEISGHASIPRNDNNFIQCEN